MKLRRDPLQIFRRSTTPAGLYARKKWLEEPPNTGYRNDFEETVRFLTAGQRQDGSWEKSFIKTIQKLFWLHLTVRDETEPVRKGLDWLRDHVPGMSDQKGVRPPERIPASSLAALPFAQGSSVILITSATLFLSTVFGRKDDPVVCGIYDQLADMGSRGSGRWCGWSSYCNILRALVVHPVYSGIHAVDLAVANLGREQKESGAWNGTVPFYLALNALAHLDCDPADVQLEAAFRRLYVIQKEDGTWSRAHKEWNSFLAVHALKNKGKL